ncbi:MAG: hypothetical protein MAG795_00083 [Candidatus Woesearchaeota archaeon]|nr:hypothetical protein [Candidatus Woesearchaeota archaeon]
MGIAPHCRFSLYVESSLLHMNRHLEAILEAAVPGAGFVFGPLDAIKYKHPMPLIRSLLLEVIKYYCIYEPLLEIYQR